MTDGTKGLRGRLTRVLRVWKRSLFADRPAFPERVQHHLVAFEIEQDDSVDEIVAIRSHGSVYQVSNYVAAGNRTVSLHTDRGTRVVKSDRIVGLTILESWNGRPPEPTFDSYRAVFERHGWTERTAYPEASGD